MDMVLTASANKGMISGAASLSNIDQSRVGTFSVYYNDKIVCSMKVKDDQSQADPMIGFKIDTGYEIVGKKSDLKVYWVGSDGVRLKQKMSFA